jgi:hypothetical protein
MIVPFKVHGIDQIVEALHSMRVGRVVSKIKIQKLGF